MSAGLCRRRPEYIPKPLSPPSRTEGVLQVLQLIVNNADTVETVYVPVLPKSVHPRPGNFDDFAPLASGHGLERTAERKAAPRLHFDEGDESATPGDEVDLDAADTEPVGEDVPATGLQETDGLCFTGKTALMARIGPLFRITVNPARHGRKVQVLTESQ